jgi:hypothetical protein
MAYPRGPRARPVERPCDRCGESFLAHDGYRYCKPCRTALVREMRASGYLTPLPWRPYRPPDAREASESPGPAYENAVRFLEDG